MAGRGRTKQGWSQTGRAAWAAEADRLRAERARALIAAAQARAAASKPRPLVRPGVSAPTTISYATTSDPQHWSTASAGSAIITTIGDVAEDGADRLIFAWPSRPGGGFVAAAMALQEARTSGALGFATFGYWPWRNGATWAARSVLVNPADLLAAARRICTEVRGGADWADRSLAHEALAMVELRLAELMKTGRQTEAGTEGGDRIIVRSPSLLETTAVFPPGGPGHALYSTDADQILRRVRKYTLIHQLEPSMRPHLAAAGDPMQTPFALLGLPPTAKPEALHAFLQYQRVVQRGLDVVVVDLTQVARRSLSDDWEKPFAALVAAIGAAPGRRPPLAVITEDGHALGVASRVLRAHCQAASPKRPYPVEIGAYLPRPGVLGPEAHIPSDLPPVVFEPDIKDASLAPIRRDLLTLGAKFRQRGDAVAADAATRALRFLRRAASLPLGLSEARDVTDILHTEDDEVDRAARAAFRPKMELAGLQSAAQNEPVLGAEARRLAMDIEAKVESWAKETPVSAKLATVLDASGKRATGTMIAVPTDRVRDVFLSSDRAQRWDCDVVAPENLAAQLAATRPERLIVVGPNPEIVRVLLTSPEVPAIVVLIGDTAGVGLVCSELRPITRIEAFRPLAARAEALLAALARGGGDEKLDFAEAEFRVRAAVPEGEVDFTRSGDDYKGDVVRIGTSRGGRFAYRPGSDVLVHSAGELRPFVRREARRVQVGDLILALGSDVRETLRRALSGSRRIQRELASYHGYLSQIRAGLPGTTVADKVRRVLAKMQQIEPSVPDSEVSNIRRWITADAGACDAEGYRMPGAPRDWRRFKIFGQAVGIPDVLAKTYWQAAVVPTRAYRAHEGHGFNQQVVQFVLDPEATAIGAGVFARLPDLWQLVLAAVDEVVSVTMEHRGGNGDHA